MKNPFSISSIMKATQSFNPSEAGVYMRVIMYLKTAGKVPETMSELYKVAGAPMNTYSRYKPIVEKAIKIFQLHSSNVSIYNPRIPKVGIYKVDRLSVSETKESETKTEKNGTEISNAPFIYPSNINNKIDSNTQSQKDSLKIETQYPELRTMARPSDLLRLSMGRVEAYMKNSGVPLELMEQEFKNFDIHHEATVFKDVNHACNSWGYWCRSFTSKQQNKGKPNFTNGAAAASGSMVHVPATPPSEIKNLR
jgi:hypothetical protein